MGAAPRVSVVVVNHGRAGDAVTALRGVRDGVRYGGELELLCVDNSDDPGEAGVIRGAVPEAAVLTMPNRGFGAACNLAVERATGEVVGFLNSDARPDENWVAAAVETLRDKGIAAVASKVLDWDGATIDYAGAAVSWFGMGYKPDHTKENGPEFDRPKDVLFPTGAAMFVRRDIFRAVGGFDERYFMFYEDVDLGWRLNLRGHRVRYEPRSLAYHRHHASMAGAGEFRELYLLELNALITLYKNLGDRALRRVLPAALALAVRRGTARGGVDPRQFELTRRGTGDDEASMMIPRTAVAPLLAIDRFVELLPGLGAERRRVQRARRRSDRALRPLLGTVFEPLVDLPDYRSAHDVLVAAFGVDTAFRGSGLRRLGRALVDWPRSLTRTGRDRERPAEEWE
ncbi:MAG TPA: glycosyltransferase family 2 protein [Pseudonocardiaceae bacterium]